MAILDSGETDLSQLWSLITELSEQLSQNRSLSVSLYSQAANVKNQAVHSQTGFVLRRFNLDKTIEEYESELERMNASMAAENQALQHDNKQLNTLIKEYEQTLETLMSNFRNRARDVQERELSIIREYETQLLTRQEEEAAQELASGMAKLESFSRIAYLLRQVLRLLGGEEVDPPTTRADDTNDREPWMSVAAADHALEKEIDLARLEKENEELRRMLGIVESEPPKRDSRAVFEAPVRPEQPSVPSMSGIGSSPGSTGPYGTIKRMRSPG